MNRVECVYALLQYLMKSASQLLTVTPMSKLLASQARPESGKNQWGWQPGDVKCQDSFDRQPNSKMKWCKWWFPMIMTII